MTQLDERRFSNVMQLLPRNRYWKFVEKETTGLNFVRLKWRLGWDYVNGKGGGEEQLIDIGVESNRIISSRIQSSWVQSMEGKTKEERGKRKEKRRKRKEERAARWNRLCLLCIVRCIVGSPRQVVLFPCRMTQSWEGVARRALQEIRQDRVRFTACSEFVCQSSTTFVYRVSVCVCVCVCVCMRACVRAYVCVNIHVIQSSSFSASLAFQLTRYFYSDDSDVPKYLHVHVLYLDRSGQPGESSE